MLLSLYLAIFLQLTLALSVPNPTTNYHPDVVSKPLSSRALNLNSKSFYRNVGAWIESLMNYIWKRTVSKNDSNQYGIIGKVASDILTSLNTSPQKQQSKKHTGHCIAKFGTMFNEKCYKHFGDQKTFADAQFFCKKESGDIWTPNLRDPFLYQKLMKYMPEIAGAREESVWIGYRQSTDGRSESVTGTDVSDAFLIQILKGEPSPGSCFVLDFQNGGFHARDVQCTAEREFLCEYKTELTYVPVNVDENQI